MKRFTKTTSILQLQNISVQKGHQNPNFSNFDSGIDFGNDDFGFNPNGGF